MRPHRDSTSSISPQTTFTPPSTHRPSEHLLVRATGSGAEHGEVIGTYRVLNPAAARRAGGLCTDTEFDLQRVRPLLGKAVELGRSCVHPRWRCGGVVIALWGALGEFMLDNDLDTMVGCASISMRDGGHGAASLWARLRQTHLVPPEWQVAPRLALPVEALRQDLQADTPALIKGYLRRGAKVLGAPAWAIGPWPLWGKAVSTPRG